MTSRRRYRWLRWLGPLAAIVLLAGACGGDDGEERGGVDSNAAEIERSTGEPVAGGEVVALAHLEVNSMDPIVGTGSSAAGFGPRYAAVYGALVTFVASDAEVEPWMAESLTPNEDFSEWTLTLHEGLQFSDGTPFDADAVRVNWERAQVPENRSPSLTFASFITSMEVVDPTTLVVSLAAPDAQFAISLARRGMNYIASPTAIQTGDIGNEPVGAGPYVLTEWTRDDRMVFDRNPRYFDAPRPYVDRIVLRVVTEERQRIDTFTTGDAGMVYSTGVGALDEGAEAVGGNVSTVPVADSFVIMPNNGVAPFDDLRMRRVLAMAIDRDAFVDITMSGSVAAMNWTVEGTPWFTTEAELPVYDPAAAQALVDEIVAERGAPIEFTISASAATEQRGEFVQTSLNQLEGLEVRLDVADSSTNIDRIRGRDYELAMWGIAWLDPNVSVAPFFRSGDNANYSQYANSEVDELMTAASATTDVSERAEAWSEVFEILSEDLPSVPVAHERFGWAMWDYVEGLRLYEDGIPRWDLLWRDG